MLCAYYRYEKHLLKLNTVRSMMCRVSNLSVLVLVLVRAQPCAVGVRIFPDQGSGG